MEDSPTDTNETTETGELEGCAAVAVCGGDPDCHFMVGDVDGLNVSCSNDSGAWMLSVQATGLPQHAYNAANVSAQDFDLSIPLEPEVVASDNTSCPQNGEQNVSGMQGVLINGVSIHRALTPDFQDPVNPPRGGS